MWGLVIRDELGRGFTWLGLCFLRKRPSKPFFWVFKTFQTTWSGLFFKGGEMFLTPAYPGLLRGVPLHDFLCPCMVTVLWELSVCPGVS